MGKLRPGRERDTIIRRRSPNNALELRRTSNQTDDVSPLPKRQQQALIKLAKKAKHMRIRALFSGPGGTGKTSAARFLARKLDLELYRIDLGGVISKYIGETEKGLDSLFNEAEDSGAMLFIDEADALFRRRSEVKDAHDRYANITIDYLRERIENFPGLIILATRRRALFPTFTPKPLCRLWFPHLRYRSVS
jgi:SpoVK/Ycf46/Vps4 family AAA+-type ATPase